MSKPVDQAAIPNTWAEYLGQGELWYSKGGLFPIRDMDAVYRRRAIRWLTRNCAEIFRFVTMVEFVDGDTPPSLETMIRWVDSRPSIWIQDTELYQALQRGLPQELT
jgi:hypothetical protein